MSDSDKIIRAHKHFEMGTGLYHLVGLWSAPDRGLLEHNPNAYNNEMASRPACCHFSCDHCGMPITHHFMIEDTAGQRFSVGSSCIDKLNDTELTTAAKLAEKKRKKELRAKARHEKMLERQRQYEAEMDAQRERNGGLTDEELKRKLTQEAEEAAEDKRYEIAYDDVISVLYHVSGDFTDSMANKIIKGDMPTGRARTIIIEILAKQYGRKNSKAYKAAYPECEALYERIEAEINAMSEK